MPVILRNYQDKVINDLDSAFDSGVNRNCIVLPTGAGKTIIAGALVSKWVEQRKKTLFLVHRQELVRQTAKKFASEKFFGLSVGFHASGQDYILGKDVDIGMIQTISNRLDKFDWSCYENVISDEAHHSVSPTFVKFLNEYCRDAAVTGLTATPQRPDGIGLDGVYKNLILGPDTATLIKEGALSRYRLFCFKNPFEQVKLKMVGVDFDPKEMTDLLNRFDLVADAVDEYKKIIPGKKAIAFFPSIESSKAFTQKFNANGIPAGHIDSYMKDDERDQILRAFECGLIKVLCNVNMVSEGFDVPDCDAVMLFARTASVIRYLQMLGRALRIDENNPEKLAYLLDFVQNFQLHGSPIRKRDWSLKGRKRRTDKDGLLIEEEKLERRCWKCHCVPLPEEIVENRCPECKSLLPVAFNREKLSFNRNKDALSNAGLELTEIDSKELDKQIPLTETEIRDKIKKCNSLADFQKLAKEAGYKPGWAYKQFQYKQYRKKRPDFNIKQAEQGGDAPLSQ